MLKTQIAIFNGDKKEWVTSEGQGVNEGEVLEFIQQYDWKEQIKEITEKLEKRDDSYTPPDEIGIESNQGLMLWILSWDEGIYTISANNNRLPDEHPDAFIGSKEVASIDALQEIIASFIQYDLESLRLLLGEENSPKIGKNTRLREKNFELSMRETDEAIAEGKLLMLKYTIGFWLFWVVAYLLFHELTLVSLGKAVLGSTLFVGFIYGMGWLQYYLTKKFH